MEGDTAQSRQLALERQLKQCRKDYTDQCRLGSVLCRSSRITASSEPDLRQDRKFSLRTVCNKNLIVYITAPHHLDQTIARAALVTELHKANPTLLLERRGHFIHCKRYDQAEDVELMISDHLAICDWAEAEIEASKLDRTKRPYMYICPQWTDLDIVLPTMRAVFLLYTPPPRDSDDEHVTLILTGDCSRMRSGPITFDDLLEHQLPGYKSTENVIHVTLEKAAQFIAQLDRREIAANEVLQERNAKAKELLDQELLDEAREICMLAETGQRDIKAEIRAGRVESAERKFELIRSEIPEITARQAALRAGLLLDEVLSVTVRPKL